MLQPPKGVPGMAFSIAGNLARIGKKLEGTASLGCEPQFWAASPERRGQYSSCEADTRNCTFLEESVQCKRVWVGAEFLIPLTYFLVCLGPLPSPQKKPHVLLPSALLSLWNTCPSVSMHIHRKISLPSH